MKIAILGYDVEGRASYDYFAAQGHELEIRDQNRDAKLPSGAKAVLGEQYLDNLEQFDLLVRTAGLHPSKILAENPALQPKITTHINEFLRVTPTRNIIGVTGTKGKGTTSTLIAEMLKVAGQDVQLGGNIGIAPLTFLNKLSNTSWVVLELTNFQLIDAKASPHIAVCVMTVPEHLDWHKNLEEYITAKQQLFVRQTPQDIAIYFAENETSKAIAAVSPAAKIPYYTPPGAYVKDGVITIDGKAICKTDELKLLGRHNWQNVCAAVTAVWQVSQDVEALRKVLTNFSGLPHRLEFVRELDGVKYYNDSFSSGLVATEAAVSSIEGKKVLIVGGFERHLNLDHFGKFAKQHAAEFRTILLIGESAERIAETLRQAGFDNFTADKKAQNMSAVVGKARSLAQKGDVVVLSPGFASFDMFKNFEDRGLQFKAVVESL